MGLRQETVDLVFGLVSSIVQDFFIINLLKIYLPVYKLYRL